MGTTSKRYSAEVRERAVRMVSEHREEYGSQWAAIQSTKTNHLRAFFFSLSTSVALFVSGAGPMSERSAY
jgi:hypothetical protein